MRVDLVTDPEHGSLSLLVDHVLMAQWPHGAIPAWTADLQAAFDARHRAVDTARKA